MLKFEIGNVKYLMVVSCFSLFNCGQSITIGCDNGKTLTNTRSNEDQVPVVTYETTSSRGRVVCQIVYNWVDTKNEWYCPENASLTFKDKDFFSEHNQKPGSQVREEKNMKADAGKVISLALLF